MKKIAFICILLIVSCNKNTSITRFSDYQVYLQACPPQYLNKLNTNNTFWRNKVNSDITQSIYYSKLSASEGALYKATGKIKHLKKATKAIEEAVKITDSNDVGLLHQLIQNYTQQHRFLECLLLLNKAEKIAYKKRTTDQLLFDTHLELGNPTKAKTYLDKFKNYKDFNYLIRAAKWKDFKGQLSQAVSHLEHASQIANEQHNESLQEWAFSNLGDFYGHQGEIEKSYHAYLKALKINPNDTYSLKGIAWVLYSHEKNIEGANRIVDTLINKSSRPDYLLLKSKITRFKGQIETAKYYEQQFINKASNPEYGNAYYTQLIEVYLESDKPSLLKKALSLAEKELNTVRKTATSYSWYARALASNHMKEKATAIIKKNVLRKTEEPKALYNAAIILKGNPNDKKIVLKLKEELESALYELGPNYIKKIGAL